MDNSKVFVIAEAGVNHNGSVQTALGLVDAAKRAGADAIKFQTFKAASLLAPHTEKAEYQKLTTSASETQDAMIQRLELPEESHKRILEHCNKTGVLFLSSPFDLESVELLRKLNLSIVKVPSGEINNVPLLRKIATLGADVILSSGMSTLGEIEQAIDVLCSSGVKRRGVTVLHCNTAYPTAPEDVNLLAMCTIRDAFQVNVGYSDHTIGPEIAIAAVALGAKVIEKHITLSREMEGPDHKASMEPDDFTALVQSIRDVEVALGTGVKAPTKSERPNFVAIRKSIVAATHIRKGESFNESNITLKRPGDGLPPSFWDYLIGRSASRDFVQDEKIDI